MSRDMDKLDYEFRGHIEMIITETRTPEGYFGVSDTWRSPRKQAAYWVGSRSTEVEDMLERVKGRKALHRLLSEEHEKRGDAKPFAWKTNALPGYSWHQLGFAVDLFWNMDGKGYWDRKYLFYAAEAAKKRGLNSGYFWRRPDSAHIQMYKEEVHEMKTPKQIDDFLELFLETDDVGHS